MRYQRYYPLESYAQSIIEQMLALKNNSMPLQIIMCLDNASMLYRPMMLPTIPCCVFVNLV
jgi:hypothetical protein